MRVTHHRAAVGHGSLLFSDIEALHCAVVPAGSCYADASDGQCQVLREAWAEHGGTDLGTAGDCRRCREDAKFEPTPDIVNLARRLRQRYRELAADPYHLRLDAQDLQERAAALRAETTQPSASSDQGSPGRGLMPCKARRCAKPSDTAQGQMLPRQKPRDEAMRRWIRVRLKRLRLCDCFEDSWRPSNEVN
jgi:hypothetical protein